eukprot:COSAG02_NODE_3112_length_7339_cov_13.532182_6_plen_67_part_00
MPSGPTYQVFHPLQNPLPIPDGQPCPGEYGLHNQHRDFSSVSSSNDVFYYNNIMPHWSAHTEMTVP